MFNRQNTTALILTLVASAAIAPASILSTILNVHPAAIAQTSDNPTSFPLPETVPSRTTVRVDGSSSMIVLNETLKQNFEAQYPGTSVELESQGSDVALQALLDGSIDLAAIGRPLTDDERAQGLVQVPISREKIAIIVGPDNPFSGDLTFQQFAQIFRGEISDWSEVGGAPGSIRVVDRPDTSDTRLSLSRYDVFQGAPFETGENAVQVADDDTGAVIRELGSDGISYAIASQVLGQDTVNVVSMHQTLPDDPAYPFSQPRGYVYYQTPSPAAQAFLGYATANPGQAVVEAAKVAEAEAIAEGDIVAQAEIPVLVEPIVLSSVISSGAIAFSPDAAAIAGAGEGNTVRLWNLDGTLVRDPFVGHENIVRSVIFSPSGDLIASAGDDSTIRLWDLDGNAIGEPFLGHDGAVRSLAFSPDGQTLVSAGDDSTIRLWALDGTPLTEPFRGHSDAVESVAVSPDGQTIVSGGEDGSVRLWGFDGLLAGQVLSAHEGGVNSVSVSPDGQAIASTGEDGSVRLWSLDGTPLGVPFLGHDGIVNAVAFSPVGQALVSGGNDGTVRVWAPDGTPIGAPIVGHEGAVSAVAFSPDGETLASGGADGTLRFWTLAGEPIGAPVIGYAAPTRSRAAAFPLWLLWLLPLVALALLIWWLLSRQSATPPQEAPSDAAKPDGVKPEAPSGEAIAPGQGIIAGAFPAMSSQPYLSPSSEDSDPVEGTHTNRPATESRSPDGYDPAAIASVGTQPPTPQPTTAPDATPDPATGHTADSASAQSQDDLSVRRANAAGGAAIVGGIAAWATMSRDRSQSAVEAARFNLGQPDHSPQSLADVDQGLPDLPDGYGGSSIVLLPRDPQWAYAYWDIPNDHREALRQQGGQQLALRLYDVTDVNLTHQKPHSVQQYACDELARTWYLPIPVSDRDYVAEIGYVTSDGNWLMLARSAPIRIPPVYPSSWFDDQFITVQWDEELRGKTVASLVPPEHQRLGESPIHETIFGLAQSAESMRVAGSLFGSMQQVPQQAISSYVFPSGVGMAALPTLSGVGMSGIGMSGVGMSGIGMSGIGFAASVPPIRPRKFWLIADAELIVYGATEPDATVMVGDRPIPLNPDGTFRFHISFQDGEMTYPIRAIAADGEQMRSVQMDFERETPHRQTNTKDEAQDEWFGH